MDEIGLTTTQNPVKIIVQKENKQFGQITSAERGKMITVCWTVNANGNSIPSFTIFPFVHFKQHMIKGAPVGTVDFANLSGWINSELFLEWDYNNNYVCNLSIKINLYFTFLLGNDGCVH